jgi:hypothetical protein
MNQGEEEEQDYFVVKKLLSFLSSIKCEKSTDRVTNP